jgi:hypothetical protein
MFPRPELWSAIIGLPPARNTPAEIPTRDGFISFIKEIAKVKLSLSSPGPPRSRSYIKGIFSL